MAELPFPWPKNSWAILTKIIRAWYSVETSGGDITQKRVAEVAGVQQSQVSTNKAFLQAIGIIGSEGTSLTDAGKRLGIGLYSENESMQRQGLDQIIRGRGSLKANDFFDEVALRIGGKTDGFTTGTAILMQILELSGAIEIKDNTLRPSKDASVGQPSQAERQDNSIQPPAVGLNRIPIAVSTNSIWFIEVGTNPKPEEIQKFLEMQKLMFG
jgi:hypothetical protein